MTVEKEGAPILRSALVAVGLQRAPEHLFDPRFENAELVYKLSQHDDMDVTQYAVWAINENSELGIKHLGFKVIDLQSYPPNIRGWTYRLYGEAEIRDGIRHEVIAEGSKDVEGEARLNLARGLQLRWYDGLEQVTCPWFHDEQEEEVREEILIHMVRQSEECNEYRRLSLEIFKSEPPSSHLSKRMLASAKGKSIYREFRRIEYIDGDDLFSSALSQNKGVTTVTNNTYNINNIQSGAVSFGGDAKQDGNIINNLTPDQIEQVKTSLAALVAELRTLPNQTDEIKEVTALVEATANEPEQTKLLKVRNVLKSLFSNTASIAKFGGDVSKILSTAEKFLTLI